MVRMTMTFDDDIYYPIKKMSVEEQTTFKNIVMTILRNEIYKPKEVVELRNLQEDINECLHELKQIKGKQRFYGSIVVQEFVNHGYLSNANPNESVSYQDLVEKNKNKFND